MISIFQYLADSFRLQEFPSVLRSTDYPIDNKQIDFNCFFRILPSKYFEGKILHECHLNL